MDYLRERWELSKLIRQQCAETGNWNGWEAGDCTPATSTSPGHPLTETLKDNFYSENLPELEAPPSTREAVRVSSPKFYKPRPPSPKKEVFSQATVRSSKDAVRSSRGTGRPVSATKLQSPVPNKTQPLANNLNTGLSAAKSVHTNLNMATKSVLRLQSLIRGFSSRLRYKNLVEQRQMQLYREYKRLSVASVLVQRVWRGYTVRRDLWNWLPWLHSRVERRREMERGVVAVQSLARGWIVRKRITEVCYQCCY